MNISTEEINDTRKKLVVSVSGKEVAAEEKKLLGEFSRNVKIPGFRPGKAPASLIRKRYGKELESELNRKVISEAYEKSIKDSDLDIYNVVNVDDSEFSSGKDGKVEITVDITPSFNLPEYKGIPAEITATEVTEDEVNNAIEEIQRQRSEFLVVEHAVEKGNFVKVSYEGKIKNKPIADLLADQPIWGKQENTWEEAGTENSMGVKAVVDGLVGMKVGEKKDEEMKYPKDFSVAELAGKAAVYSMEVHEVRERVMPELNDEFLKQLHVESVDQLKKQLEDEIKRRKEYEKNQSLRQQITETLDKRIEFSLPESAVEFEARGIYNDIKMQNRNQGVADSEFEKHDEEIRENAKRVAASRVKMQIILGRIAKDEKIEVSNEDFQSHILSEAMQTGTKPEQVLKDMQKKQEPYVCDTKINHF